MKFRIVDECFKKYAEKDPEKIENHTDDEVLDHIYNELKKERLDLCYKEASKRKKSYYKGDKNEV